MEADSVVEEARAKAVSAVNDLSRGRRPEDPDRGGLHRRGGSCFAVRLGDVAAAEMLVAA